MGFKKTRKKHEARVALIAAARQVLADSTSSQYFRLLPVYSQLRRHLSPETISAVQDESDEHGEVIQIVIGDSRHSGAPHTLNELSMRLKNSKNLGVFSSGF